MGDDIPTAIRHFGECVKIFFAHFRDVEGAVPRYTEVMHDDGPTDMFKTMQTYYDVGFEAPMRPDHGANLEEAEEGTMAKIFAIGYMRGPAEIVEKTR